MPRFHFNIYDGSGTPDHSGTEFDTWEAARIDAVRLAGAILIDNAEGIIGGKDWCMEVTDDTHVILFRLDLSLAEAPVLSSAEA